MRDMPITADVAPPIPRTYRGINWDGFRALYVREVRRFWKVGLQTLAAPIVTALLYMMVFVVAIGGTRRVEGVAIGAFIAPGLIMMQILNNAFSNSSSSLLQAKMNGLIGDFLTPPCRRVSWWRASPSAPSPAASWWARWRRRRSSPSPT